MKFDQCVRTKLITVTAGAPVINWFVYHRASDEHVLRAYHEMLVCLGILKTEKQNAWAIMLPLPHCQFAFLNPRSWSSEVCFFFSEERDARAYALAGDIKGAWEIVWFGRVIGRDDMVAPSE